MLIQEKTMKKVIATLILTILFTAAVQAGFGPFIDDVLVTDLGGGLTLVEGSLVGVRFADDDVQQIGCRVAGNRGGDPSVACAARDLNEDVYLCFSFDPALIEAAISISPYSYVRFVYDETAECETIFVSVRSHHIPDSNTEKSKTK
jgi:hypothetical protein